MKATRARTRRTDGWMIVERSTGKPLVCDGRWPIYWLRKVANRAAVKYFGPEGFRLVKVRVLELVTR